ncbi:MAG: hypothetical protein N2484_06235 [Clostridia bacterium]|nr:hypothetical protein [Clostridia bacterium]
MYKMEVDAVKKVFLIVAEGFFTMEEGQKFTADYQTKTNSFKPQEYTLIVDAKEIKPSSPEVAQALQAVMGMYIEVPFKKRFVIKLDSTIAQSQVQRLGKALPGFDLLEFVDSIDEALKKIN